MSNPQPTAPPAPAPLPRPAPQPAPSAPPPGTIPPEHPARPTTAWRFDAAMKQAAEQAGQTLVRPSIDELAAMLYHLSFPNRVFVELPPMVQWSYRQDAQRLLVLMEQRHA